MHYEHNNFKKKTLIISHIKLNSINAFATKIQNLTQTNSF